MRVLFAQNLKNVDWVGKSDPYFKVSCASCACSQAEAAVAAASPSPDTPKCFPPNCAKPPRALDPQIGDFNGKVIGGNDGGEKSKSAVRFERGEPPASGRSQVMLLTGCGGQPQPCLERDTHLPG